MDHPTFTVAGGRLLRDGRPFAVLGVNYHPSRAGCRVWSSWDPHAIDADFAAIADAGLNTVRFFVFWRDVEPEPGAYDVEVLHRVGEVAAIAARRGLACIPSLCTIWMNGQRLDLPWRRGRSLWRDPVMIDRADCYVRVLARVLRDQPGVLAVDLGDEIANVDVVEASSLSRREAAGWVERLAGAVRDESPAMLVLQANDASGVLGSSPFGPDSSSSLDLIGVHGYPLWSPGSIESTSSFKATHLAAFLAGFAAAFGVPLVDELGSYGTGDDVAARYLRAAAASAFANGAAGVIVWCWQDIASSAEPYRDRPGERLVGLRRLDGSDRPTMTEYRRVAALARALAGLEREPAPIAIYVPRRAREAGTSYLDTGVATMASFFAYLLLKRAHLAADIVAGDLAGYDLAVCPSVRHLTLDDVERLARHAEGGGTVYLSVADHVHGFPGEELAGVERIDFSLDAAGRESMTAGGESWPIDWSSVGGRTFTVRATTADIIGTYADGTPALTVNRVGRGRVVLCTAPVELQLDHPGGVDAHPWEAFYRLIADLAGVRRTVDCADAAVEVAVWGRGGASRIVVVNHGEAAVRTDVTIAGRPEATSIPIRLEAKGWRTFVVECGDDLAPVPASTAAAVIDAVGR